MGNRTSVILPNKLGELMRSFRGDRTVIEMARVLQSAQSQIQDLERGRKGIRSPYVEHYANLLHLTDEQRKRLHLEAARYAGYRV